MANLRRSNKNDNNNGSKCKKHPKHKQSPGVCSICLNEKLARLSSASATSRSAVVSASSSSLSSYYSSSSVSSYASPRYGVVNNKGYSLESLLIGSKNALTKSRSLVFIPRTKDSNKKKGGFFSNMFQRSRSKRPTMEGGLMHSRTVREIEQH